MSTDNSQASLAFPDEPDGPLGAVRWRVRRVTESRVFDRVIMTLIVINAVTLGMETSAFLMSRAGAWIDWANTLILWVFVLEIALRLFAQGWAFWRDPWRLFDFAVVGVALLPATGVFSALRAFRILRVLRLISAAPSMRRVVQGLLQAIPGMTSIVLLLLLIFYVFAVMATKLFGASFPDWFGSIGASAYSLFQIMTLESWSMGIVRPVMEQYPYAWAFFVPFIVVTAFMVLNLFIGIIVDAMQSEHFAEAHAEREEAHAEAAQIIEEVRGLRDEIQALRLQMNGKSDSRET